MKEENNEQEQPKGSVGNTRLPFGLCAKYHIGLPDNATPRDAWNALRSGVGLTPEQVYADLKKKDNVKQDGAEKTSQENRIVVAQKEQLPSTDKTIKRIKDIKNKFDLVDYVKQQHNIELENDPNETLNRRRNFLYTKIPKNKYIAVVSDLKKHGFSVSAHLNDYYWISVKPVQQ